jgi:hypothetical protein
MKKFLILGSLFAVVFLIVAMIAKEEPADLEIVYVDELNSETPETIKTCVLRRDKKLVLIDVSKITNENIYLYVLKVYDHYQNSLPPDYVTPFSGHFEVLSVEKKGSHLTAVISSRYVTDDLGIFARALMQTYHELGIETLDLSVNKEVIRLTAGDPINTEIESFAIDAVSQVIYYQNGREILPVTYIHSGNQVDFLLGKLLGYYSSVTWSYETDNGFFTLEISDPEFAVDGGQITMLLDNLRHCVTYPNIVIIKNGFLAASN